MKKRRSNFRAKTPGIAPYVATRWHPPSKLFPPLPMGARFGTFPAGMPVGTPVTSRERQIWAPYNKQSRVAGYVKVTS